MGNAGADLGVFIGTAEEIHHFLQLLFLFLSTCHIREGDLLIIRYTQHRTGSAEVGHGMVAVQPAHNDRPENEDHDAHQQRRQHEIKGAPGRLGVEIIGLQNALLVLGLDGIPQFAAEALRIGKGGKQFRFPVQGFTEYQVDTLILHDKFLDLPVFEQLHHLGIGKAAVAQVKQAQEP